MNRESVGNEEYKSFLKKRWTDTIHFLTKSA